jgi:hypothetical protein
MTHTAGDLPLFGRTQRGAGGWCLILIHPFSGGFRVFFGGFGGFSVFIASFLLCLAHQLDGRRARA